MNLAAVYSTIEACVSKSQDTFQASSEIECAIKCESAECKAFQFNVTLKFCNLYGFHEICQFNSICRQETVFVNNKYNNMYMGDSSGARLQIIKGVNFTIFTGIANINSVLDENKAFTILKTVNNFSIMVLGTYKHSKMVALPNDDVINGYISKNKILYRTFFNNLVTFLTGGICTIYSHCYGKIDRYKEHIGKQHLVFGIQSSTIFDFANLTGEIEKHNWHFIIGKSEDPFKPILQNLMKLYGMCSGYSTNETGVHDGENYCQNVTNVKSSFCY